MTTLVDRYVDATLRRLPARQRPDIERELRASIADAVDDRVEAGTEPAAAERTVITELGDPARLAAGYADRPLQLIGPEFFLDYRGLLTLLMATVVPAVAAMTGLQHVHGGAGELITAVLGAAVAAAVHVGFWTTLLFAAVERISRDRRRTRRRWSPDDLPAAVPPRARRSEVVIGAVVFVVVAAVLLFAPLPADLRPPAAAVTLFVTLGAVSLLIVVGRHVTPWRVPLTLAGALVELAGGLALAWFAKDASDWVSHALLIAGILSIVNAVREAGLAVRSR